MFKLIMLNWSYFRFIFVLGSSVSIHSIKLNLFLVSIFDISVGWIGSLTTLNVSVKMMLNYDLF